MGMNGTFSGRNNQAGATGGEAGGDGGEGSFRGSQIRQREGGNGHLMSVGVR